MGALFLLNTPATTAYFVIKFILLAIAFLCAMFMIYIILVQPSNSSGIGALGGSSETFLSKNKSKTKESMFRRRTVIVSIIFAVALVAYVVVSAIGLG